MNTIAHSESPMVTIGVDTHLDTHVAVALDQLGRRLADTEIRADDRGYRALIIWAESLGTVAAFGIEGTGCYGAGLARAVTAAGHQVLEVIRPNRRTRRQRGKSDLIDAEAAARAVLAGENVGPAKGGVDLSEAIRVLRVQRQTAVKARTAAINAMRSLLVTGPDELRRGLRGLGKDALIAAAAALRPSGVGDVTNATKTAVRGLARRCQHLDAEIATLDEALAELVAEAAPELTSRPGFGTDTVGQLIVTAGDNPDRLRSEASFSMLCGASPKPTGSGKTNGRHRLNRGGDRLANAALYRVVLVRMRWHQPTKDYVERRTKEGKSKVEIMRCLKRYVAREAYAALMRSPALTAARAAA